MPKEVLELYSGLSVPEEFYLRARWRISPIARIEEICPRKGKICDLGCGAGLLSNFLALKSAERDVAGIDISPEKIKIAGMSARGRDNIRFITADVTQVLLESPDVVVACDLIHHIPPDAQSALFGRIYASLKDGGLLLIQDIDRRPFAKYLFALAADKISNMPGKVYYRPSNELTSVLKEAGFEVQVIRIDRGYPIAAVLFKCNKRRKP